MRIILLIFIVSVTAVASNIILTKREFAFIFAKNITDNLPVSNVNVIEDNKIAIYYPDGSEYIFDVSNAYFEYQKIPTLLDNVIKDQLQIIECINDTVYKRLSTTENIIPLIKNKAFIAHFDSSCLTDKKFSDISIKINDEICIQFWWDNILTTNTLTPSDFDSLGLSIDSLYSLALANFSRDLADIECYLGNHVYHYRLPGSYVSSIILCDEIWVDSLYSIEGDMIVAIPDRGLLAMADSKDSVGMANLREFSKLSYSAMHPVSDKLFIRKDASWEIYRDSSALSKEQLKWLIRAPLGQ